MLVEGTTKNTRGFQCFGVSNVLGALIPPEEEQVFLVLENNASYPVFGFSKMQLVRRYPVPISRSYVRLISTGSAVPGIINKMSDVNHFYPC